MSHTRLRHEHLSTKQAAAQLRVSEDFVRNLVKWKFLIPQRPTHPWFFLPHDPERALDRFLKRKKVQRIQPGELSFAEVPLRISGCADTDKAYRRLCHLHRTRQLPSVLRWGKSSDEKNWIVRCIHESQLPHVQELLFDCGSPGPDELTLNAFARESKISPTTVLKRMQTFAPDGLREVNRGTQTVRFGIVDALNAAVLRREKWTPPAKAPATSQANAVVVNVADGEPAAAPRRKRGRKPGKGKWWRLWTVFDAVAATEPDQLNDNDWLLRRYRRKSGSVIGKQKDAPDATLRDVAVQKATWRAERQRKRAGK